MQTGRHESEHTVYAAIRRGGRDHRTARQVRYLPLFVGKLSLRSLSDRRRYKGLISRALQIFSNENGQEQSLERNHFSASRNIGTPGPLFV
jgi:hypothetical protein